MKRLQIFPHSLSGQMILSFVALVLLTAAALGLPALWLLRDQLARQVWAQVEQGSRATQALYVARQSAIADLATLTAQRPTLRDLLADMAAEGQLDGDTAALTTYLETLKAGAGLDLVLVCDPEGHRQAHAGAEVDETLCATTVASGFHVAATKTPGAAEGQAQAWLYAVYPITDGPAAAGAAVRVLVANALDDAFALQMRDQTGLEHTVLVEGRPVASSMSGVGAEHPSCRTNAAADASACRVTFSQDGAPYYAVRIPLDATGLEVEAALPVSGVVASQRRLGWTLAAGILAVVAVGSGAGALLARRIGRPLTRLAVAADALSSGDLTHPIHLEAQVREVTRLAQALEGARADLQHTLAQLRREKAWIDHLLEAIVEGIVTLDGHGRITFFSHGAERVTGWPRDEVLGRSCDQVFRLTESDEPFSQHIPPPGSRHKIAVELRDGRQAVLSVTGARLLPPGRETGAVNGSAESPRNARVALVFRDVSEEEAVHRLLGHFLANVAHEFRTPLAAVAASVELLLDQAPDLSLAELSELLVSLHLGVLGLQTLVDNLLESASIETGHFRVSPRPSDLGQVIAEAIRIIQPLLDKRGQRLTVALPVDLPIVQADPRRTVQVLVNLLSNASKYGPDNAEIAIHVSADPADRWVRVAVADQGPGIPAGGRKSLFRRFAHSTAGNDKAQYGVGLGLSVVKAIVEAHGGQVGMEDRPGGGTVFWLTLPRGQEP